MNRTSRNESYNNWNLKYAAETLHTLQQLNLKRLAIPSADKAMEKMELSYITSRMQHGMDTLGKVLVVF